MNYCRAFVKTINLLKYTGRFRKTSQQFQSQHPNIPPKRRAQLVEDIKYLEHIITNKLKNDDDDIVGQILALSVKLNMISRLLLKRMLFIAFYIKFYSCELWANFKKSRMQRVRVQYNAYRIMFDLPRHCSASNMLTEVQFSGFTSGGRVIFFNILSSLFNWT